jgi:hypothetical protein
MDHVDDYSAGGPTALDNLALFCPTRHDLKTYSGWQLTGPPGNRRFAPPDGDHDHQPAERVLELVAPGPP